MITLTASALSADAFAPFGQVLSAASAARQFTINGGNTERFHDLAELSADADGRLIVSLFRGQPRALPFAVSMLERHPLGSQAFLPLGERLPCSGESMPKTATFIEPRRCAVRT